MGKLVVLNFEAGDFDRGFPVTVRITSNGEVIDEVKGEFPKFATNIFQLYKQWQADYKKIDLPMRITTKKGTAGNSKEILQSCRKSAEMLKYGIKAWLNSEQREVQRLRETLLRALGNESGEISVLIQTKDPQLKKLPWQEWEIFADIYTQAEMAISPTDYSSVTTVQATAVGKVRILAILGDDTDINPQQDRNEINNLPRAEAVFLEQPQPAELIDRLRAEPGWDILFFAGHSSSTENSDKGQINISREQKIGIGELKKALNKAVRYGLKLAIFNSCDGLGLAEELADLHLPQIIVMREMVPDRVAQNFLKVFLKAFANGKSLYNAVWEARESLEGLEREFPGATWLPVIYQNPAATPPTWEDLVGPQLETYLATITERLLQQQSGVDIQYNIHDGERVFDCVAKIKNYELFATMLVNKGDAFFIFSAFDELKSDGLNRFSAQCLEYAKKKDTSPLPLFQLFEGNIPTRLCFAVAIVPELDEKTKHQIRTQNHFRYKADWVWYEVPVVYVLNEGQLYFFDMPSFWDQFQGEIAWKSLRKAIEQTLIP